MSTGALALAPWTGPSEQAKQVWRDKAARAAKRDLHSVTKACTQPLPALVLILQQPNP